MMDEEESKDNRETTKHLLPFEGVFQDEEGRDVC
jgi:hypothetical protein